MNVSPAPFSPHDDSFLVGPHAPGWGEPIALTPAGAEALARIAIPDECDICRKPFAQGDPYFRVTLGMDETPSHVGAPIEHESTVEETSELIVCADCEPAVAEPVTALLSTLWAMRKPDSVLEDDEPTVPVSPPSCPPAPEEPPA